MKLLSFNVRPETDQPSVSHEELVIRVNVLANECARLSRELASLRQAQGAVTQSTVGPIPTRVQDAKSGRALIRMIAVANGKNEDTVRQSISRGAAFAPLREKCPDICTNVALMRWLATGDHYARIMSGANIADVVRGA